MERDSRVEFPPYRLDLASHELWRGAERLALRPKPFAVLAYLATHAGRLVPHAELARAVWPDTHVGHGLLRGYVRDVRAVLGDDPAQPRFIETVARLGYRFVAPAQPIGGPALDERAPVAPSGDASHVAGMVGRDADLRTLEGRLAGAIGGQRQVVFVTGEPGVGKTTLVDGFVARATAGDLVWTARGQCVEHFGPSEAYLPVLEALARLGRSSHGEQVISVFARHAPTWLVQLPGLILDAGLEAVQRRVQGATRERMLREFAEGVEVLTAVRPLVLVLEDLQWSDDSTLDLLSSLAQRRGEARLLVLCTYRPEDVVAGAHPLTAIKRDLQMHGRCDEMALASFGVGEVAEYLAARLPARRLAPDVAASLHQATEGNPLFVVNLVDSWIARDAFVERDGEWLLDAGRVDVGTDVPDTLRQTIERQSDRLAPAVRQMLEAASVAGGEFSSATVAAALDEMQDRVDTWCEELATRGFFLRARGVDEIGAGAVAGRYAFLHALYRQVLYERLALARRVRLHRRIGEWLEGARGTRVGDHAAELAVHFERGHDRRAVPHLESAAQNAIQKHAFGEATVLLGRALDLLAVHADLPDRGRRELSLRMALATSLMMIRGYAAPEVEREFSRARELARHMDDCPELVFALAGLFRFYFSRAEVALAGELANQVLALAETRDRSLLAVAHSMAGPPLLSVAKLGTARGHFEQAIAIYRDDRAHSTSPRQGDNPALTSLAFLSLTLWFLGYPDQALERSLEGQELAEELGAPYGVAFARSFLAWLHVRRGDAERARLTSESLMLLATDQGFPFFRGEASIFRGWALAEQGAEQGDVEAGVEQMLRGLAEHRAAGVEMGRPSHLALLAEAYAKLERVDDGLAVIDEALAMHADGSYEADLHRVKGDLLRRKAERAGRKSALETQAEVALREALAIARRQESRSLELRAAVALCRLRQTPREQAAARARLKELYGWFTEGLATADLRAARALLGGTRS